MPLRYPHLLLSLVVAMLCDGVSATAQAQARAQAAPRAGQADRASVDATASQLTERALAQFHAGKYTETLALLDLRATVVREDHGMSLIRAWSLYHLNRLHQALALFTDLDRRQSTKDTQYGIYYSRRRLDPTHIGD